MLFFKSNLIFLGSLKFIIGFGMIFFVENDQN